MKVVRRNIVARSLNNCCRANEKCVLFALFLTYMWLSTINKTGNVRINATLRRVRESIVAVEKQTVLQILSVCL